MKKIVSLVLAIVMLMSLIPMSAFAATVLPTDFPENGPDRLITSFDEDDAALGVIYDGSGYYPQYVGRAYGEGGTTVDASIVDEAFKVEYTAIENGKYATAVVYTDPAKDQHITAAVKMLVFHFDASGVTSMEEGTSLSVRLTLNNCNGTSGNSAVAYILDSKTIYFQADGSDVVETRVTRASTSMWNCYLDINAGESGTYYIPVDAFILDENSNVTNYTVDKAAWDTFVAGQATEWKHSNCVVFNFRSSSLSVDDYFVIDDVKWMTEYPVQYKHRVINQDFSEFVPNPNWTWTYGNMSGYANDPSNAIVWAEDYKVIDGRFAITPSVAQPGTRFSTTIDEIGDWKETYDAFAFDLDLSETTSSKTLRLTFGPRARVQTGTDPESGDPIYDLKAASYKVMTEAIYFINEDGSVITRSLMGNTSTSQIGIPDQFKGTVVIPKECLVYVDGESSFGLHGEYDEFAFIYEILNWTAAEAEAQASIYIDNLGYYTNEHIWNETYSYDEDAHWIECSVCCDKEAEPAGHEGGEATCSAKAVCDICGASYGEYAAHSLTVVEASESDHLVNGNIEYWACDNCGKLFSDAEGTTEIELADTVLPLVPHDFDVDWSRDEENHWKECTCTTKDSLSAHDYDNACDTECNTCGHIREITHNWETEYAYDADSHWIECHECGTKQAEPVAHEGGEATCSAKAVCDTCGASYGEYADHVLTAVDPSESDHKTNGNIAYWDCDNCDKLFSDAEGTTEIELADTVLPLVPHDFDVEWSSDDDDHWKECACGEEAERDAHEYDNDLDDICNICDYEREITANGWYVIGGKWYFLENGVAVTETWKKDSIGWCYLGVDGAMVTNAWVEDTIGWCFVGENGYCVTNTWKRDSKGWCYLNKEGSQVKNNWVLDGGKWYFIDAEGYMVSSKWMKDSKGWLYLGSDGAMVTNGWVQDTIGWCYVGEDGYCLTNTWKRDSKGWCYLNKEGSQVKNNWVNDGGKWYFIDAEGYMVTGKYTVKGVEYTFNASGVWVG